MKKYKGSGWYNESHRHSLAAKGIKTGRKVNYSQNAVFYTSKESLFKSCLKEGGIPIGPEGNLGKEFREWKKKKGIDTSKTTDMISGGLADNMPDSRFDSEQISKGIKVELEHTHDEKIAKEIAKDHLIEHPRYYDYLEEMEQRMNPYYINYQKAEREIYPEFEGVEFDYTKRELLGQEALEEIPLQDRKVYIQLRERGASHVDAVKYLEKQAKLEKFGIKKIKEVKPRFEVKKTKQKKLKGIDYQQELIYQPVTTTIESTQPSVQQQQIMYEPTTVDIVEPPTEYEVGEEERIRREEKIREYGEKFRKGYKGVAKGVGTAGKVTGKVAKGVISTIISGLAWEPLEDEPKIPPGVMGMGRERAGLSWSKSTFDEPSHPSGMKHPSYTHYKKTKR